MASEHAPEIEVLFWVTTAITFTVFILTQIVMFYFGYKYRFNKSRKAHFYPENHKLEIIWTVIPAIVLVGLIGWGLVKWNKIMGPPPEDAEVIEVVGYQFAWASRYPGPDNELGNSNYKLIDVDNIVGIDSAIFSHPTTWKASGHVDAFNDPMIDNKDSKKRYRADNLIEDYIQKIEAKINKEKKKQHKRFGENFDEKTFLSTNPKVLKYQNEIDLVNKRFSEALNQDNLEELKNIIEDCGIVCPISGTKNWTDVKQFNLMFKTQLGSTESNSTDLFLRPETAQGIFLNYLNVQKTGRMKIPFGIAQIGKAFRNEIVARQFIFRMREFEIGRAHV